MLFKPPSVPHPPINPTEADATIQQADQNAQGGFQSLVSTSPMGIRKGAYGQKRSLIGGAQ
jgi:hypothetical protein